MRAASDFVRYRNSFQGQTKQASSWGDMLSQAGNYIADNEWAQGALGGGVLGGLTGLLPGQSIGRNALIGAGLGGAAGGLYQMGSRPFTEQMGTEPQIFAEEQKKREAAEQKKREEEALMAEGTAAEASRQAAYETL